MMLYDEKLNPRWAVTATDEQSVTRKSGFDNFIRPKDMKNNFCQVVSFRLWETFLPNEAGLTTA
jgi:hypothetical protein